MAIGGRAGWRGPRAVLLAGRSQWFRRAVLLGVTIGVAVMHHLVGGLEPHLPAAALATPAAVAAAPALGATVSVHTGLAAIPGSALAGVAEATAGAGHGGHGDGMAMMGHLCLAVLAGLIALTALAVALLWRADPSRGGAGPIAHRPRSGPRASPSPLRLAQLQVLRL